MTCRLIWSDPIRPPVRPSRGQGGVLQAIDHSVAGSMTAQPPGIRPSALRVATYSQQEAALGGGVLPLYRGSVGVFYSSRWQGECVCVYVCVCVYSTQTHKHDITQIYIFINNSICLFLNIVLR